MCTLPPNICIITKEDASIIILFFVSLSSFSPHVSHPPPLHVPDHLSPPPTVSPHATLFISLSDTVEVTAPVLPLSLISGSLCKGVLAHLLFLAPITLIKAFFLLLSRSFLPFVLLSVDINDTNAAPL